MTEIRIQKNFGKAFGYFLRALRFHELHFILNDIPIPSMLVKKRYLVPARLQDTKEGISTIFLFLVSFFTFLYLWIRYQKRLNAVLGWIKKEKKKFINLAEKIPSFSGYSWKQDIIPFYPVVGGWAGSRFGAVYIGTEPDLPFDARNTGIILHELIHVNASAEGKKKTEHLISNWDLADEFTTVLMTRRMERELLCVAEDDLQPLPVPLRDLGLERKINELEETARHASFASLLLYCSKILPKDNGEI